MMSAGSLTPVSPWGDLINRNNHAPLQCIMRSVLIRFSAALKHLIVKAWVSSLFSIIPLIPSSSVQILLQEKWGWDCVEARWKKTNSVKLCASGKPFSESIEGFWKFMLGQSHFLKSFRRFIEIQLGRVRLELMLLKLGDKIDKHGQIL